MRVFLGAVREMFSSDLQIFISLLLFFFLKILYPPDLALTKNNNNKSFMEYGSEIAVLQNKLSRHKCPVSLSAYITNTCADIHAMKRRTMRRLRPATTEMVKT